MNAIEHQGVVHRNVLVHDKFAGFSSRHSTDVRTYAMKLRFAKSKQLTDVSLIGFHIWVYSLDNLACVLHYLFEVLDRFFIRVTQS
jgi:hypothetical protein